MELYHISTIMPFDNPKTFTPYIPKSAPDWERKIPRICFSSSIRNAIAATGYALEPGDTFWVYSLNTNDIPDNHIMI